MRRPEYDPLIQARRTNKPPQYAPEAPPAFSGETDWRVRARTVFWNDTLQRWSTKNRGPALMRGLTQEEAQREAAAMNGESK